MKLTQSFVLRSGAILIVFFAIETTLASEPDVITAALIGVTSDVEGEVRLAAYQALSAGPGTEAVIAAFRKGLDDDDVNVQRVALDAFVGLQGATDEVIYLLISRLSDDGTSEVAAKNLRLIGQPAIPMLIDAMDDSAPQQLVIEILARTSHGELKAKVIETIVGAMKDDDKRVRLKAIDALRMIRVRNSGKEEISLTRFAKQLMHRHDNNSDGVLTEEEWQSLREDGRWGKGVSLADGNRDGQLTVDEMADWMSRR